MEADLSCGSTGLIIGSNNIHIDGNGYEITGNGEEFSIGIDINGYDFVTISDLRITNFKTGIYFYSAANYNNISNNIIDDSSRGIYLFDSDHNEINRNYIHNGGTGVYLETSHDNRIVENTIDLMQKGIEVSSSNNNVINLNAVCNHTSYDIQVSSGTGNTGDNICDNLNVYAGGNWILCSKDCDERGCVSDTNPSTVFQCGDTVTESCTMNFDLSCSAGGFLIGANNIKIDGDGYRLTGDAAISDFGIVIDGDDDCNVTDLEFRYFGRGIYFYSNSNYNNILGCKMEYNDYGVWISSSTNNIIRPFVDQKNYIINSKDNGIYLDNANDNKIYETTIQGNGDSGIYLDISSNNLIENNTMESNSNYGIQMYISNNNIVRSNKISQNNAAGLSLDLSDNNAIENNNIYDNSNQGIFVSESNQNNITINNITENIYGIWSKQSDNNLVKDNNINSNYHFSVLFCEGDGIFLDNSDFNSVENNTIDYHTNGISINHSKNNSITNNNIRYNEDKSSFPSPEKGNGVYLLNVNNTLIQDNYITNNNEDGISLLQTNNVIIQKNDIISNDDGIYATNANKTFIQGNDISYNNGQYGILDEYSNSNLIYNNSITKNYDGIFLYGTNTTIFENYICNNTHVDIFNSTGDNKGWLNYCDTVVNWNDMGSSYGCMYSCSVLECTDNDGDGYPIYDILKCPIGNDCNDNNKFVYPGADETYCNGIDEDCSNADECYCYDNDGDGAPEYTSACPLGFDCDDNNPNKYPGAIETNCNEVDEDCDGQDQCNCTDNDKDDYAIEGGDCSWGLIDCNDYNPNIHPNVAEIYCNGLDEDCSGSDDCNCDDNDNDGYYKKTYFCPTGTDCEDDVDDINPGANETCYNWIDENCNGMTNEGCNIACTKDADCSDGRLCIDSQCECPNGQILDLYLNDGSIVCDPVGRPKDTPCGSGWAGHEGSDVDYNEDVPACDLYEVNRSWYYANGLLPAAENARDCCVGYYLNGNASPGCCPIYTPLAYSQSGLNTSLNYDNMKRCIGLYEFYGLGPRAEYMQHYYQNEIDCGHDVFAGFGSGCLGSTWLEDCCIDDDPWYCHVDEVSCDDKNHTNTAKLRCKEDVGTPSGWATDFDMYSNGCCFSDLPAHASIAFLSTGTCVDYSVVLTTLLRLSGYKKDEVYSARSQCPNNGHVFNLIKFPGDAKYTLVDTVGNCGNGYHPMALPTCNKCYYWFYHKCSNDNGKVACPPYSKVWGAEWVEGYHTCLNELSDLQLCEDKSLCLIELMSIESCAKKYKCENKYDDLKNCISNLPGDLVGPPIGANGPCRFSYESLSYCVQYFKPTSGSGISASGASIPKNPTLNETSKTEGNIKVTRTIYNEIYIREIVRVNITIENNNNYPIDLIVKDRIAGAIVFDNLNIPQIPPNITAPPMPYVEFTDTVPAYGKKSFTYSLMPVFVGHYSHSATEVRTSEGNLIYLDTQMTQVKCISDGVCNGTIGENYINCEQDCWSGAEDGICNSVADDQCDPDCMPEKDPDCRFGQVETNLLKGWNLIGYTSSLVRNVTDVFIKVINELISVASLENGSWYIYAPNDTNSNLEIIKPLHGYWVNVKNDTIWYAEDGIYEK